LGGATRKKDLLSYQKTKKPTHTRTQSVTQNHTLKSFLLSHIKYTTNNFQLVIFLSLTHTHTPITCYNFKSYTIIIYISNSHSIAITLAVTYFSLFCIVLLFICVFHISTLALTYFSLFCIVLLFICVFHISSVHLLYSLFLYLLFFINIRFMLFTFLISSLTSQLIVVIFNIVANITLILLYTFFICVLTFLCRCDRHLFTRINLVSTHA